MQNQIAKKMTSGNKPAQMDPMRFKTSPKNQMEMNPMAMPSADWSLHCSINWGINKTIQQAKLD